MIEAGGQGPGDSVCQHGKWSSRRSPGQEPLGKVLFMSILSEHGHAAPALPGTVVSSKRSPRRADHFEVCIVGVNFSKKSFLTRPNFKQLC